MKAQNLVLVGLSLFLVNCAKKNDGFIASQIADDVKNGVGCGQVRSLVFDSMYKSLDHDRTLVDTQVLKQALSEKIQSLKSQVADSKKEKIQELDQEVQNIFDVFQSSGKQTAAEQLQTLIELEFGNTSTAFHIEAKEMLSQSFQKIQSLSHEMGIACAASPDVPGSDVPPVTPTAVAPAIFGAHFAMATAYQSCGAVDLPIMTSNTDDVEGIQKGKKIGGGFQREYLSISDIVRTHYYIRGQRFPASCVDVAKKPLVYDYGGQPAVEATRLNFFVDAGSGGKALGIDCSAFISSGLAAAGLRYSPGIANKPIFARQVSTAFVDPVVSGWKCFARLAMKASTSIAPGDIMGVRNHHVVMVDRVGNDPFGISRVSSAAECAKISSLNFDFAVIQSSPSKNSIGINRFEARDYLEEDDKMKNAFVSYAKAACLARFSGKDQTVSSTEFGLIRHKGTAECKAPRMELAGQSCVSDCRQFRN